MSSQVEMLVFNETEQLIIGMGQKSYQGFMDEHADLILQWPAQMQQQLPLIIGYSQFITTSLHNDPELIQALPQLLQHQTRHPFYADELVERLAGCETEDACMKALRVFRRQEMVCIAWRDFLSQWDLKTSLAHLSLLAESLILASYQWNYQACTQLWGTPHNDEGKPQTMQILGMGKLGGGELNFSSDIDLIFTYPENGETKGARRSIDNAQFFTRLGQRVIKSLDQVTQDGFCYRVDMRLRPFGDSGPLVMSYSALEDYYQEQGRDWERYAMVKARVMAEGINKEYQQLQMLLRPFVFRRYIDFSAIDALRRMKAMIRSEVRRRGLVNNIKLGAGGIREIEFIVQVFQLIRGGREPSLRGRGLLSTLCEIKKLELLTQDDTDALHHAYVFLRRLENLLQALDDAQTQTLPETEDDQLRLACAMGFEHWSQLITQVEAHMQQVNQVFEGVIGEEEGEEATLDSSFYELWDMAKDPDILTQIMSDEKLGCIDADHSVARSMARDIHSFKNDLNKKTIGPRGRDVLNRLMPKVFAAIFAREDAQFGLARVLSLLQHIVSRTAYLELLETNHGALFQLVRLCSASPMISEQLSRYPILLDELLDSQQLYQPTELSQYLPQLREFLARIPEDDMEQQMEALRQFKQIEMLKIAAADVTDAIPVMKISDHLTYLAQSVIHIVIEQAWQQLKVKYGQPSYLEGRNDKGFGVIAYGKLGGIELGYQSDLDLVFLHQAPEGDQTNGAKQIDSFQFYLRLVQRIIHIFSMRMPSGILYEIDTRLRPCGESGLLASRIDSFERYQQDDAWTWEHQALVRARLVYSNEALDASYQAVREKILSQPREEDKLKVDIVKMREKMRQHLDKSTQTRFYLKQGVGGLTDIEFLVQYWVLSQSKQYPQLLMWSDNVRIIETMASIGLIESSVAKGLIDAYTGMRDEVHHRNLLNLSAHVDMSNFIQERDLVKETWNHWLG